MLYWVLDRLDHHYKEVLQNKRHAYDDLLSQNYDIEDERDELKDQIINLNINLAAKDKEIELRDEEIKENEESYKKKYEKLEQEYKNKYARYEVVPPVRVSEDIKKLLKMWDNFTKNKIIEYLQLDSHELVKNIAGTVNDDNASNVITFMDGALSRNFALIKTLDESIDKRTEYNDKIAGELKTKSTRATKEI